MSIVIAFYLMSSVITSYCTLIVFSSGSGGLVVYYNADLDDEAIYYILMTTPE